LFISEIKKRAHMYPNLVQNTESGWMPKNNLKPTKSNYVNRTNLLIETKSFKPEQAQTRSNSQY
jgi:hypothetical protein